MITQGARLGIVVIGRNEGPRLSLTLEAARRAGPPMVYVDSNSEDQGVQIARDLGVPVLELRSGCTAARGRQVGTEFLLRQHPSLGAIQYLDGDCELDSAWLSRAYPLLAASPRLAAVAGRRREVDAGRRLLPTLIDLDWDQPAGPTLSIGGDVLLRIEALRQIGGWDKALAAGEDPDLAFRLHHAGWQLLRLPDTVSRHDSRIMRWSQCWARAQRSGQAYAQVGIRHATGSGRPYLRRAGGIAIFGGILPAVALALLLTQPLFALLPLLLIARQWLQWVRYACRRQSSWHTAFAYAGLQFTCQPAMVLGELRWLRSCIGSQRSQARRRQP